METNFYKRIQEIRAEVTRSAKKSGRNKFAGYDYYELSDFLPIMMKLMRENNLFHFISFTKDEATLTIMDCDKPEDNLVVTSPTGTADLTACHDIQNIGAVETYQRRYLYIAFLELCENDALDAGTNQPKAPAPKPPASQKEVDEAVVSTPSARKVAYNAPKFEEEDVICSKCGAKMYVTKFPAKNGSLFYYCSNKEGGCKNKFWPEVPLKTPVAKQATVASAPEAPPVEAYTDDDVPF